MALSKFLLSVDWSSDSEIAELPTLLGMWKVGMDSLINLLTLAQRKAPVDVSEALKLLSGGKAFQSPLVRSYAVDVLRNASDQELQILLLQLVQALRYEPTIARSDDDLTPLSPNTIDTSETDNVENSQDEAKAEGFEDAMEKLPTANIPSLPSLPPLARFLISRACTSTIRMVPSHLSVDFSVSVSPSVSLSLSFSLTLTLHFSCKLFLLVFKS
jgi:hypothetical protein